MNLFALYFTVMLFGAEGVFLGFKTRRKNCGVFNIDLNWEKRGSVQENLKFLWEREGSLKGAVSRQSS